MVLQDRGMVERPTREGLDRELETFISMRDQTDQATEVPAVLNTNVKRNDRSCDTRTF